MLIVHEIQDKRAKKAMVGPSTKEGRSEKKKIARKKIAMRKLLDEMYMWRVVGTEKSVNDPDVRLADSAVKEMLKSGQGPWRAGGAEIYWGRIAHRCRSDLARCHEVLPVLVMEKLRCERWSNRTLAAVQARLGEVGEESGRGLLLKRWHNLLVGVATPVVAFKFGI